MKKIKIVVFAFLAALMAIGLIMCAVKTNPSSGESTETEHKHTVVFIEGKAATCEEDGLTPGEECEECGEILVKQEVLKAFGHKAVTDEAYEPTCTEDGKTEGSHCEHCGTVYVEQESIPALGHEEVVLKAVAATCSSWGKTEGVYCSRCKTVLVKQEDISPAHILDEYGICTLCGESDPHYLRFVLNTETQTYSVGAGAGFDRETVKIPDTFKGLPVVEVFENAFSGKKTLKSITFGANITKISNGDSSKTSYAFYGCENLQEVVLNEGLQEIGLGAFYFCSQLSEITIPSTVVKIDYRAFSRCSFESVYIPSSVVRMGNLIFGDNLNTDLVINCAASSEPSGWSIGSVTNNYLSWNSKNEKFGKPTYKVNYGVEN